MQYSKTYIFLASLFLVLFTFSAAFGQQVTFIGDVNNASFTGNQGGGTPLFNQYVPSGTSNMFIDWEVFNGGFNGDGQTTDCRIIIRGMTASSDGQSVVASDVVCTVSGADINYNSDAGNNDDYFANLNVCNLPDGRYSIEIQCDELGGDFDNTVTGTAAITTWDYNPPESPTAYYLGSAGACGQADGLDNIQQETAVDASQPGQLEYITIGDADVYRTMVVFNNLFFDMGKFQPGNPTLPNSLNDLSNLYDPACVAIGTFPANGFCSSDALTLDGAETNTTKYLSCGNADVTGNTLYYRVYPSGSTPGAFSSFAIPFNDNCMNGTGPAGNTFSLGGSCQDQQGILDQRWQTTSANIDIIALATTPGNYTIDIYTETTIVDCGGTASIVREPANTSEYYTTSFVRLDDNSSLCRACNASNGTLQLITN